MMIRYPLRDSENRVVKQNLDDGDAGARKVLYRSRQQALYRIHNRPKCTGPFLNRSWTFEETVVELLSTGCLA